MSMDRAQSLELDAARQMMPRRKVRKGTHSCAECKRRKIRCIFDSPSGTACIGCRRRGTVCIGQEYVDVLEQDETVSERLKRVEQLLERVTNKLFEQSLASDQQVISSGHSRVISPSSEDQTYGSDSRSTRELCQGGRDSAYGTTKNHDALPARGVQTEHEASGRSSPELYQFILPEYAHTCRALHASFPSQRDTNLLFEAGRAAIFLQVLVVPYDELFNRGNVQGSSTISIQPPVTAHPVLLARKLLHHALSYQQLNPTFDLNTLEDATEPRVAMHRYYHVASSMVTCHDELIDSLEGLECLVCESVYLTNCGSLRRALVSLRRAATIAQLLGLHRTTAHTKAVKQHDPATRVSTAFIWAHIAYLERYISLLLGISSAIVSTRFATDEKLPLQDHAEWFEKTQIDLCEHIITRNQQRAYDFEATLKIDSLLNNVASSMPIQWWAPLSLASVTGPVDMMSRLINTQLQIIHYNLLTVLHLPYILRPNTPDHVFDYNRETCLYASREVLTRWLHFRGIMSIVYCCRPVDFCAFTAAMTLLLAHLSKSGYVLDEQRVGDRALIEKTLDMLDELHRLNEDDLSRETASLARRLFDLEMSVGDGEGIAYSCDIGEGQSVEDKSRPPSLCIQVPYFGLVCLTNKSRTSSSHADTSKTLSFQSYPPPRSGVTLPYMSTKNTTQWPPVLNYCTSAAAQHNDYSSQNDYDVFMPDLMAGTEDWAFQGVDTAFFDCLMDGGGLIGGGDAGVGEGVWTV